MTRHNLGEPVRFATRTYDGRGLLEPLIGLDVGAMVREEMPDASWSTLFAYCYRRLGPPNQGSDDFKEIARWMVTTPMDGVVLSIRIAPTAVWTAFDGYVEQRLFADVVAARDANGAEYRRRFAAWHEQTHGDAPPGWNDTLEAYGAMTAEERAARSAALSARWREYDGAVPVAEREPPLPEPLAGAQAAIRRTLRDLSRAVVVRDQEIDAGGVVVRHGAPKARPYRYAGHWTPGYMMGPDIYPIHDAIERLGGGTKGLKRLGRIVDEAVPPEKTDTSDPAQESEA